MIKSIHRHQTLLTGGADGLLSWRHQVNSVGSGDLALLFQVGEHALIASAAEIPCLPTGVSDT